MRILGILLLFLQLAACSMLSPVQPVAMHTYLLTDPISSVSAKSAQQGSTLVVSLPTAPQWLSNSQMAYQLSPAQINYFGENQWAAPPAELLQPIIIHALQQSGRYRAVMSAPFAGTTNYRLDVKLLQMQQQFWSHTSQYIMTLQLQLVDGTTDQAVAAQRVSATVTAAAATPEAGVAAANQALVQLLPKIVRFCNQQT